MHPITSRLGGAVLGLSVLFAATPAGCAQPNTGTWKLINWVPGDSVHLKMSLRMRMSSWNWGENEPLAKLKGLTREQLHAARTKVAFTMARDAGTFTYEGSLTLGIGGGTFGFIPDPAYASKIAALGYDAVTAETQFEMALRDVTLAFAEGVRGAGLKGVITAKDLVRFTDHGVNVENLREIAAAGYTGLSGEDVIDFRNHGVDGAYLRGLKASGYPQFPADDIVRLHDHGVDTDYVGGLKDSAYATLEAEDVIRLHDHGVNPRFVKGVVAAGYGNVSVDDLIRLRDHGVDSQYMAKIQSAGFGVLTVEQIVKLRDHGVD